MATVALLVQGCDEAPAVRDGSVDSGPAGDAAVDSANDATDEATPVNLCSKPEQRMPCCYRTSNATRRSEPELRLTMVEFDRPVGFAIDAVTCLFRSYMESELVNWLLRFHGAGADGPMRVTIGFGEAIGDGENTTFRFHDGDADEPVDGGPGLANRWDPIEIEGEIRGERFWTEPARTKLLIPIREINSSGRPLIEIPIRSLRVRMATLTLGRTCVGEIQDAPPPPPCEIELPFDLPPPEPRGRWDVDATMFKAFITVEEAKSVFIPGLEELQGICAGQVDLCCFLTLGSCDEPQEEWADQRMPDSFCPPEDDGGPCEEGCTDRSDPQSCNAFLVRGRFAAAGVTIEPR